MFGTGYSFWEMVWALLMHLVPTAIVVLILVLAWHWARVGGVLFPLLGVLYIVVLWTPSNWPGHLLLSGPLVPLIVPLTLLKHHLNRYSVPEWVHQQVYLHPYPEELMLRNRV